MSKSRSFSIYLLKPGVNASNVLKEDNKLCEVASANKLPENTKLFLLDNIATPVWWRAYFGIEQELNQVLKGAILFIDVDNRCFAITLKNNRNYSGTPPPTPLDLFEGSRSYGTERATDLFFEST